MAKFPKSAIAAAMGRRDKPVQPKPKVNAFLRDPFKAKGKPIVKNKMDKAKGFKVNTGLSAKGAPMVKTLANRDATNASGAPMVRTPMGKR